MSGDYIEDVIAQPSCRYEAHYNMAGTDFEIFRVVKGVRHRVSGQESRLCREIMALRRQVAAQPVAPRPQLAKVRAFLHRATTMYTNPEGDRMLREALAELDEAEGVTR